MRSAPGHWRDNVAAIHAWIAAHPGWSYRVDELPGRKFEHVATGPDGTEHRHHDLGTLVDELERTLG